MEYFDGEERLAETFKPTNNGDWAATEYLIEFVRQADVALGLSLDDYDRERLHITDIRAGGSFCVGQSSRATLLNLAIPRTLKYWTPGATPNTVEQFLGACVLQFWTIGKSIKKGPTQVKHGSKKCYASHPGTYGAL